MADRPKHPEPFADATEISVGRREDTAVDEPVGLGDAPSTDLGAPPSAAETEDRSVVATQPDQPPAATSPTESQQRPAPLPPEFDTENAPPSAFAEATVQMPTFGRGGEQAPPSRFADATVPLQVQRERQSAQPRNARGARRLPVDVEKSRAKRTMGEEESAQNVRRIPSSRPRPQSPQPQSAEPETDFREPADAYAHLPSFDEDDDIYGQPTEALTFRDDAPSLPPSRASTFDTPSPLAPAAPATDDTDAPGHGDGVPSSWIPSDLNAQNLAEEADGQSQDGFPSSWIPDAKPHDSARRIPSEILAEAGQTMTRTEQAERNRDGPHVPVPLPLDESIARPVEPAAIEGLSAAAPVKQETGTWNPGASDSAFVPGPVPLATPAPVPADALPPAAANAARNDVTDQGASVTPPTQPKRPPRKKGGCAVVAGAGCLFFFIAAAATGGIWFWYQQQDPPGADSAVATIGEATKTRSADSPPQNGSATSAADATEASSASNAKSDAKADAKSDAKADTRTDADAKADAKPDQETSKATPALDPSAHEDDEDRARPRIRRRGSGTFVFRPTGGKRLQRLAYYAAVRAALKGNGLALAGTPVRKGFDVVGKVRGSRIDDDGEALRVETDCRLTVREQPSGKRIRAISGTGVAKGTPAERKTLIKQAISACGRNLTKDIIPLLSGG